MDRFARISTLLLTACLLAACNGSDDTPAAEIPAADATDASQTEVETTPAPEPEPEPEPETVAGKKSVLIGHSFFRPAATQFGSFAASAGISDHSQKLFFSGGPTGSPAQLWGNANKRAKIQELLDEGGVTLFGMTYHGDEPEVDGYVRWTRYALKKNPNVAIFVALPWMPQPASVTGAQHESGWDDFHNGEFHALIDSLRAEFPDTNFFCVPYGATAHELQKLWDSGNLSDVTALTGPKPSSLYTDKLGHPGNILATAGALTWLNAIYNVDLANFDDSQNYQTNLNTMAMDIIAEHDSSYGAGF